MAVSDDRKFTKAFVHTLLEGVKELESPDLKDDVSAVTDILLLRTFFCGKLFRELQKMCIFAGKRK